MKVLGLHASFNSKTHDPGVALFINNELVFAAEEERYLRYKTSSGRFPEYSLKACLSNSNLSISDIDIIAVDGETHPAIKMKVMRYIEDLYGLCPEVKLVHHADSHCYSAYYFMPSADTLSISIDGYGDGVSVRILHFINGIATEIYSEGGENSLGDFYTAFTNYLGFKSIEGEYKVMGMAAYAKELNGLLSELISFDETTGRIKVDKRIYATNEYSSIYEPIYNKDFFKSIGVPILLRGVKLTDESFKLAGEVQNEFEKTYIDLIVHYAKNLNVRNICIAGGCALNVLANFQLSKKHPELNVSIFPAASDRGLCVGNALKVIHDCNKKSMVKPLSQNTFALGSFYTESEISSCLERSGLKYMEYTENELYETTAMLLMDNMVIGWFQGRSEFGPRALGFRSIIANANSAGIKDKINSKIKYREKYRPFAPAILEKHIKNLTSTLEASPFMTKAFDVKADKGLFGETVHEDGTARVQTIDEVRSPYLHTLLEYIETLTGKPFCIINTSLNLAGEPIVETPQDAIRTFVTSGLDMLCIGNFIVYKK